MNKNLMTNVTRTISKLGLKLKKHSPEILVVAGVTGVVGSAVMACKATTKLNDIIEDTKDQVEQVHEVVERVNNGEEIKCNDGSTYSEQDGKKDLAIIYVQTGVKLLKLYGPSIVLGAASITCILASNNILRKRNVALAAAYATVDKGFKDYRNRVVERFGKEIDRELKNNIKAKTFEEVVVDEDGTEHVETKTVEVMDPNDISEYARFFDDGCTGWHKDSEYNLMFLKRQQNYANEKLKARGYLFLNDVYDMLGIPLTKAGQIVGWIYDPVDGKDNFVDFGIYDINKEKCRDFVNGYERTILLDFNVDGNILDLL